MSTLRTAHKAEYKTWANLWQRCQNPNHISFKWYGAKGVKVCKRWKRFENFLADMGPRPEGHSIDRKNNRLGYFPSNCRWATEVVQQNNRKSNRLLTFRGVTQSCAMWDRTMGLRIYTISGRLFRGFTVERAITEPINPNRQRNAA